MRSKLWPRRDRNGAGFTLIELLVVVAIIGLLAGLVVVNVNVVRAKARDNRRAADLATLATALELYRSSQKQYPVPGNNPNWQDVKTLTPFLTPNYLSVVPNDPSRNRPPDYTFQEGGYVYATNGTTVGGQPKTPGALFVVDAKLEQRTIDAQLDPLITGSVGGNEEQNFFRTGYYQYPISNGTLRYRISR